MLTNEPNLDNYEYEPTTLSLYGMNTNDDLLRLRKLGSTSCVSITCDISLDLGELATGNPVPVSTFGINGIKLSQGYAKLNPEDTSQIQLFHRPISD